MHLPDEQIIACLDGEADESICHHLTDCLVCSACLEPYLALQQDLWRYLYRHHCPSSQTLADFYLDLLPASEAAAIQAHLAECPHCTAEIESLAQYLGKPGNRIDAREI